MADERVNYFEEIIPLDSKLEVSEDRVGVVFEDSKVI